MNDILLIEDDEGIIKLLQVHLREPAFRLTSCMGGVEGLAVFKTQNFHLSISLKRSIPAIARVLFKESAKAAAGFYYGPAAH